MRLADPWNSAGVVHSGPRGACGPGRPRRWRRGRPRGSGGVLVAQPAGEVLQGLGGAGRGRLHPAGQPGPGGQGPERAGHELGPAAGRAHGHLAPQGRARSSSSALARSRNAGACSSCRLRRPASCPAARRGRLAAGWTRARRWRPRTGCGARMLQLLGQQGLGDGGGQGVAVDRLLLVGRRDRGDPATQLGQAAGEVVEAVAGQDLQAGRRARGARTRWRRSGRCRRRGPGTRWSVGQRRRPRAHALPAEACTGASGASTRGSAISQVPFL